MKMVKGLLAVTVLASFSVTPAHAVVLLNLIDAPSQTNTPYALTFTAGSSTTAISFAGYQVPSSETATAIGLYLNNTGSSIIGGQYANFTLTPAASGSLPFDPGNGLGFAGVTAGSYDTFTQNAATTVGASYTLRFLYSNSLNSPTPSGFRVEASNAVVAAGVPEPATWAMMIMGFGAMGVSMRYRRRSIASAIA